MRKKYEPVELCACFDFIELFDKVRCEVSEAFPELRQSERLKVIESNLQLFQIDGQHFTYERKSIGHGGYRWYVRCPKCNMPKNKLYLPTRLMDREQKYLCRACHRLRFLSELDGKTERYKTIIRPLKRMQAIKDVLLKRRIPTKDATDLLDEYEKIESSLKNSPEYRLWKFKTEHQNDAAGQNG